MNEDTRTSLEAFVERYAHPHAQPVGIHQKVRDLALDIKNTYLTERETDMTKLGETIQTVIDEIDEKPDKNFSTPQPQTESLRAILTAVKSENAKSPSP
jgi:hypothetical protein